MSPLILKRAPIGWNQNDFDVLENGAIVGRIFFLDAVGPQGRPWTRSGSDQEWKIFRGVVGSPSVGAAARRRKGFPASGGYIAPFRGARETAFGIETKRPVCAGVEVRSWLAGGPTTCIDETTRAWELGSQQAHGRGRCGPVRGWEISRALPVLCAGGLSLATAAVGDCYKHRSWSGCLPVCGGYSITSSARASSVAGTVMPSALAVFILMTSWKRVGCSTGKSAGWAPLRILSTYTAALRKRSANLGE